MSITFNLDRYSDTIKYGENITIIANSNQNGLLSTSDGTYTNYFLNSGNTSLVFDSEVLGIGVKNIIFTFTHLGITPTIIEKTFILTVNKNDAKISILYNQNGVSVSTQSLLNPDYPLNFNGYVYINDDVNEKIMSGIVNVNGVNYNIVSGFFSGNILTNVFELNILYQFENDLYLALPNNDLFYCDFEDYEVVISSDENSYRYDENFAINVEFNKTINGNVSLVYINIDGDDSINIIDTLVINDNSIRFNIPSRTLNVRTYKISIIVNSSGIVNLPRGLLNLEITKVVIDFEINLNKSYPIFYDDNFNAIFESELFNGGTFTLSLNSKTYIFNIDEGQTSTFIDSNTLIEELDISSGYNSISVVYEDNNQISNNTLNILINKATPKIILTNNQISYHYGDLLDITHNIYRLDGTPLTIEGELIYKYINEDSTFTTFNLTDILHSNYYNVLVEFIPNNNNYEISYSNIIKIRVNRKNVNMISSLEGTILNLTFPQKITGNIEIYYYTNEKIYNIKSEIIELNNVDSFDYDINNDLINAENNTYSIRAILTSSDYLLDIANSVIFNKITKSDPNLENIVITTENSLNPTSFSVEINNKNDTAIISFLIYNTSDILLYTLNSPINNNLATQSYYLPFGNYKLRIKYNESDHFYDYISDYINFTIVGYKPIANITKTVLGTLTRIICTLKDTNNNTLNNVNKGTFEIYNNNTILYSDLVINGQVIFDMLNSDYEINKIKCKFVDNIYLLNSELSNNI